MHDAIVQTEVDGRRHSDLSSFRSLKYSGTIHWKVNMDMRIDQHTNQLLQIVDMIL